MAMALNFVLFQLCWFACVLGGAAGLPLAGPAVVAVAVAVHLLRAPRAQPEIALLLISAAGGAVWDSLLVAAGWLVYPSGTLVAGTAPYWIVAIWVAFATTLNVSLRWLRQRPLTAAAFGAVAGPMAYAGGAALDGVILANAPLALGALAVGWAIFTPALLTLAEHFDGWRTPAPLTRVAPGDC